MNRASTLWVFTLLLFTLLACEQRPDGVLSKSEMTEVLYDYHLAQAMADWVRGDGTDSNQPLLDAVFAKHGITEEEFDSSLVWYNAHASDLKDIYDELQERFTLESQKLQLVMGENQLAALATESGDTTNLWNGPALLILRDTPLSNLEKYSVKGDSIFRTADRFILSGDVIFMSEERYSQDTRFLASLSVDLKNKKPVGESYTLQSSGHFSIDLQAPAHQLAYYVFRILRVFHYPSDRFNQRHIHFVFPAKGYSRRKGVDPFNDHSDLPDRLFNRYSLPDQHTAAIVS